MPVVLAALLLLSSMAPASGTPGEEEHGSQAKPIIVTAPAQDRRQMRKEAGRFVRSSRIATGGQPLARWVTPICPAAIGLADSLSRRVEERIRTRAAEAGAPVSPEPCKGNVGIVYTSDGNDLISGLARREPGLLADVPVSARKTLRTGTAPVRWWYTTAARSRHGDSAHQSSADGPPSMNHYNSSLVSTQVVRALTGAMIVIDVNRAEGADLDAVTDYAAMLALAEFGLQQGRHERSILALFQPGSAVRAMTDRDLALLRMIYRVPLDRQAHQQRYRLVGGLSRPPRSQN